MNILTTENIAYPMNQVGNESVDLRYCIIDYTDQSNVDYMFIPLLFVESFSAPAVDLRIGNHRIQMPLDWSIVIGDKHSGELELIEFKQINGREFQSFCFNPIKGFLPDFLDIEIMNIFPEIRWCLPKLRNNHILAVPLSNKEGSLCCFCSKETNKLPTTLDITQLV